MLIFLSPLLPASCRLETLKLKNLTTQQFRYDQSHLPDVGCYCDVHFKEYHHSEYGCQESNNFDPSLPPFISLLRLLVTITG